MEINQNLFDLTQEGIETSKTMYSGKVIKCLVAPYHTYAQLEEIVPSTKTTFLFPEREMSISQIKSLVSMIVANPSNDEFRIITTNQNVIMDMVDTSVRVLTEDGKVVESPCKTFMANIHDIRHYLLENEKHQISKEEKEQGVKIINDLFDYIKNKESITISEYNELKAKIDLIGERIINVRLMDVLNDIPREKSKNELLALELERKAKELRQQNN